MRRPTIALAIAFAAVAAPAMAQDGARARAEGILPAEVFQEIDLLARRGGEDDIPGDLLFNKALEGVAKGVPANLLVPAIGAFSGRLREARQALGPQADTPSLVAGADAVQRGVHPDALRSIGEAERPSPVAILVLAELVESGVPTDRALALLREALARRSREQEMLDIPVSVRRLIREGRTAGDAVEQVRRSLERTRAGGLPPVPPGSEPPPDRQPDGRRPGVGR